VTRLPTNPAHKTGAAHSRAEEELKKLVESLQLPFLSSPMGKGVVAESHPYCVGAARSLALEKADVVLLVGARLNWMFQFGHVFGAGAKIIQVCIFYL
jgi:2-hydroxyacyl-CoA lyase 1